MSTSDRPEVTVHDPAAPRLAMDVLGSPVPTDRRRDWRPLLAAAVGVVGVGVAGTGIALAFALSGGGAQPEDVLPADVFALAKVDLDPAAGQKVAAYELAKRFPDLEVEGARSLKDDLLRRLFADSEVDYDEQVRPWIGSRAAVAGAPDADADGTPEILVAVAYDDRGAAERLLPELVEGAADGEPAFFAFSEREPYVLLAMSQKAADAAAGTSKVLADADGYRKDVAALDGDQVALAWADVGALWAAVPQEAQSAVTEVYGDALRPVGRTVLGVHLESDAVEMSGRVFGMDLGDSALTAYALGAESGSGLVQELPAGAVAAMSIAGFGEQMESAFEVFASAGLGAGAPDVGELGEQFGISIPDDVVLLLGEETAAGVYAMDGESEVAVRTRGQDPAGALAVAQRLMKTFSEQTALVSGGEDDFSYEKCLEIVPPEQVEAVCSDLPPADLGEQPAPSPADLGEVAQLKDGIAYSTRRELLDRVAKSGGLGDSALFRRVVPQADGAASVMFADLQAAFALFDEKPEGLDALEAFGGTSTGGPDGRFSLRLTVR